MFQIYERVVVVVARTRRSGASIYRSSFNRVLSMWMKKTQFKEWHL